VAGGHGAATLAELAELVGGWVEGDDGARVTGVAGLKEARGDQLSFLVAARYRAALAQTAAAAVLVDPEVDVTEHLPAHPVALLRAPQPYAALARIQAHFHPEVRPEPGVHPAACVDPSARIGQGVHVGPGAVVEAGAQVGDGCVIEALAHVGRDAVLGRDCVIRAQASVRAGCVLGERVSLQGGAIVGSDGFGYAFDGAAHRKIPQVGNVVLGDDVEVGACACIDRATFGSTVVGAGTKIDNLVQVGHNVRVGRHVLLVAQTGLAGSVEIGDGAALGGQVGVAGHRRIGVGARVAAKSGVAADVEDGAEVAGIPAVPRQEWARTSALLRRLGELRRQVSALQRELRAVEEAREAGEAGEGAGAGAGAGEEEE
jgi:UDP-3-O-[3-hydroxymyristoyl] glucosamine N-acyltransferase